MNHKKGGGGETAVAPSSIKSALPHGIKGSQYFENWHFFDPMVLYGHLALFWHFDTEKFKFLKKYLFGKKS